MVLNYGRFTVRTSLCFLVIFLLKTRQLFVEIEQMVYRWKTIENEQLFRVQHFFQIHHGLRALLNTIKFVSNNIHRSFEPFIEIKHIIYRWPYFEYEQFCHVEHFFKFITV